MKKLIFFIFLTSCSVQKTNLNSSNYNFDFKNETSFTEFKNKLKIYSKNSSYPDIDSNL
jgi:hypothetical protein